MARRAAGGARGGESFRGEGDALRPVTRSSRTGDAPVERGGGERRGDGERLARTGRWPRPPDGAAVVRAPAYGDGSSGADASGAMASGAAGGAAGGGPTLWRPSHTA